MNRVQRPTWAAARLALALLAAALVVPAPAQASAAPAPAVPTRAELEAGLAKLMASLPAPGAAGSKPITKMVPLSGTGPSSQLLITCTGRSTLTLLGSQGFNYAYGESTTTCPVAIDWVYALATLWQWNAGINEWAQITAGIPDAHPGAFAKSTTSPQSCSVDGAGYATSGAHLVRLGQSTAWGYTVTSGAPTCRLVP